MTSRTVIAEPTRSQLTLPGRYSRLLSTKFQSTARILRDATRFARTPVHVQWHETGIPNKNRQPYMMGALDDLDDIAGHYRPGDLA